MHTPCDYSPPLLQANIIYRIEKKILSGFPFYAFDFDMEAPPHDLPHFSFIVNGKPFTVKYEVSPKPPKTIKQVLDFIEERTGIKGGILDFKGTQMENDALFEKQAFDSERPTYRFEPSHTPQPQGK